MKFLFFLLFPVFTFAQTDLNKVALFDKADILVPKELTKMSDNAWTLKYHDNPHPAIALSDENAEVNLLVDLLKQQIDDKSLEKYKDFRLDNIKKNHSDWNILDQGLKTFNGKKASYIKFDFQAADQKVFMYYVFTVLDGRLLFFTFNCAQSLKNEWEPKADKIFESLKLR